MVCFFFVSCLLLIWLSFVLMSYFEQIFILVLEFSVLPVVIIDQS